jgi:hypothetical protein
LRTLSAMEPGSVTQFVSIYCAVGRLLGEESGHSGRVGDGRGFLGRGDYSKINEAVWDLVVQRVLTLGQEDSEPGPPWLVLTEFGAHVAEEQRWSPYDPDGYLKELSTQSPKLAQLCRMYADEALRCFRGGCYLAVAVMLGAASEAGITDLFWRFAGATSGRPESHAYREKLGKETSVFKKYELFRKYFDPIRSKLPGNLTEDLNVQFDGVFNLIRYYRNEAGHPTGTQVDRMSAFTSLVLFVPYCRRIEELGDWLETNADKLST